MKDPVLRWVDPLAPAVVVSRFFCEGTPNGQKCPAIVYVKGQLCVNCQKMEDELEKCGAGRPPMPRFPPR